MSQPEKGPERGHIRDSSSLSRPSRPRTSTKGPLDADEQVQPIAASHPSPANLPEQFAIKLTNDTTTRTSTTDFSFLLRPEIYHPLTPLNVPVAFRNSPKQPDPATPLEHLLAKGHFRAAAIASVQELTGAGAHKAVDPTDSQRIFTLLYTRLVCLTLIDATTLAAQEVKALEDLSDAELYVDDQTGEHLVPWELRVLNVRLQALGFGDPRRAVMSYHDLAREARVHISKAMSKHDNSASEQWKARLHELGVKVAGALIDMDDLSGATHQLKSLRDRGDGKIALSKALLWLHLGDADKARDCARQCAKDAAEIEKLILALCEMADGNYESASEKWQRLREDMPDDEMLGVNTAGRDILETLIDSGCSSHTLLFNLSTMYELCTDKHRNLKMKLAERVAGMDESPAGWEKLNTDFKL
ncbi:hypothetical protein ED733_002639 [Metarhizium rileyi]|uniref:Tetratricopeptide-like helical n=1 Tax=Metarhizium rileyi (strain RCEF 4871) TaxID=1649241 RepID=A0A5C6G1M1_METRR|nr:hypothetical protein ED733_002639 [Metarhizium rileyi]